MSVRTDLAAQFTADWADIPALAGWRVVATEKALDDPRVPTALIRQKGIKRLPQAPGAVTVDILLTLISHYTDPDQAADQLDDAVPAALDYLRPRYLSQEAEAVGWTGQRLAYDIPVQVIAPII